jgi:hypothetical protein
MKMLVNFVLGRLLKTLGAHKTRPAHRLAGVHKRDAPYSARREPRARP